MLKSNSSSIYIHLPFCDVICHYCDFYTARSANARHEELTNAIQLHLEQEKNLFSKNLRSVYFGGGTPSVTPPKLLNEILQPLLPFLDSNTEISLEANPHDVTAENISSWRALGINRLSIGIQSLDDKELKLLGRTHSAKQALLAVELAAKHLPNTTADLIYAVPEQKAEAPAQFAEQLASLGLSHLSAYHLTLQPQHFLFRKLPTNDQAHSQITNLRESLKKFGIVQYEVSNFAQPGFESKHNQVYWSGLPYLAYGPSAHGFDGKYQRWHNLSDWELYCKKVAKQESVVGDSETLSNSQRILEILFTGLRTKKGADLALLANTYSFPTEKVFPIIKKFIDSKHLEQKGDFLCPTESGLFLADEITQKIFENLS